MRVDPLAALFHLTRCSQAAPLLGPLASQPQRAEGTVANPRPPCRAANLPFHVANPSIPSSPLENHRRVLVIFGRFPLPSLPFGSALAVYSHSFAAPSHTVAPLHHQLLRSLSIPSARRYLPLFSVHPIQARGIQLQVLAAEERYQFSFDITSSGRLHFDTIADSQSHCSKL